MEVAPAAIQLDTVKVERQEDRWEGEVTGAALAPSSAGAARAVDDWYRGLGNGMPAGALQLDDLASAPTDTSAAAASWQPANVRFRLRAKVPASEGGE